MKGGYNLKKIIFTFLILIILFISSGNSEGTVVIPKDAIRFRVIANSNSDYDQNEKKKIATSLGTNINEILKNSNSLEDARENLKYNIPKFRGIIEDTMMKNNYHESVDINYGYNYFPKKEYKGITYNEGEYESLVVTLGQGKGENFWCVLFPPLCLLDADETQNNNSTVEYKSLVKEIIDKYF